jgi:hypothetical protein
LIVFSFFLIFLGHLAAINARAGQITHKIYESNNFPGSNYPNNNQNFNRGGGYQMEQQIENEQGISKKINYVSFVFYCLLKNIFN